MSKRLQVVVDDHELQAFQETARALGLTVSGWARRTLSEAQREVARGSVDTKLAAIRGAYKHSFPAPDIDEMLSEIEHGYLLPEGS